MQVQDILLRLRSRLNDTNYNDLRYSDAEIIDNLNPNIAYLTRLFGFYPRTKSQKLTQEQPFIHLPHLLYIQKACFDNALITYRTKTKANHHNPISLLLKKDKVSITPFKSGELEIVYIDFVPLREASDDIELPDETMHYLVYATLCKILEIHTSDDNFAKIQFFTALKNEQESILITQYNRTYKPYTITTKNVRI